MTRDWRRRIVAALALGCVVLTTTQCSVLRGGPGDPTPSTPPSTGTATETPARTITEANLITAADLPEPIGGGKVVAYEKNARPPDKISICLQQPLTTLGASAIMSRDFKDRYPAGEEPFARSVLDDQPDSYSVAMQFGDHTAADRAKEIIRSWVVSCRAGIRTPDHLHVTTRGFDWTLVGTPLNRPRLADSTEAAEVVYREKTAKKSDNAYHESVGLTVEGDRLMVTVHVFFTDESPYSLVVNEDESGFAHPQIGLILAAEKRLAL